MATEHILALLIQERDKLTRAIEALQGTKRRGRPPKSLAAFPQTNESGDRRVKGTRTFTAPQRKAQAERMKQYWAKKRKQTSKPS